MELYYDLKSLLEVIEKDRIKLSGPSVRYPLRVIFLDDFTKYKEFISLLNVKNVDLSNFLTSSNKWFTSDQLINIIQSHEDSVVIYPISEIIRFFPNDKLQALLTTLFETQNSEQTSNRRIYLPLVGLYEKFTKQFWDRFHRQKEGVPVWRYSTENISQRTKIYKLDTSIDTKLTLISNNKEWLEFWKTGRESPVINNSSTLNRRWEYFQSDNCFESKLLDDIKVFLSEIYNLNIDVDFHESEKNYWKKLLNLYEDKYTYAKISFMQFCNDYFNIANINLIGDAEILIMYLNNSKFEKWLIKAYVCTERNENGYLAEVISCCKNYDNLEMLQLLYMQIFTNSERDNEILNQRKELILHVSNKYNFEQIAPELIKRIEGSPIQEQLRLITGITNLEKNYLIKLFSQIPEDLKGEFFRKMPLIKQYLSWKEFASLHIIDTYPNWIGEYFSYYNQTKFNNKTDEAYELQINKLNHNSDTFFSWYYQFKEIPKEYDSKVIQIDAMGLEWLPLIYFIIEKHYHLYEKEVTSMEICRSKLPTITKNNKISEAEYYQDLDLLIHDSKGYMFPNTLLSEIETLKDIIINKVLASSESKIYLTADHGATCHCLKRFGKIKKYNFSDSEHEGRYIGKADQLSNNESFIKHNNYYIGIKHDSLCNLPKREVHGGATPEEVLVPLLIIEKKAIDVKYTLSVIKTDIQYSNKYIIITIQPMPKVTPILIINSKQYIGTLKNRNYHFNISNLSVGKYSAKCKIKNQDYELSFRIIGGLLEEDLF